MKAEIITNADEFEKKITLVERGFSHSWAGTKGTKQRGICLAGNVRFGLDRYWEYAFNGLYRKPDVRKIKPKFNKTKVAVVLITQNDWDKYSKYINYDEQHDKLFVYIPNSLWKK